METALAKAAISKAKPNGDNAEKQEGEMISNPVVLAVFDFSLKCPRLTLFLVLFGALVAGIVQEPYTRLKNAPMNLKPPQNKLTSVTKALKEDFRVQGSSNAADALIIWCDRSCDLTEMPAFSQALEEINGELEYFHKTKPTCSNITWSYYSPDMSALEASMYLAGDRTASVLLLHRNENLEIGQVSNCMMDVKGFVNGLDSRFSNLHMAFGTPIATAMMSMDHEMVTVMHHVCISIPILSFLFYFYVGSCVKVLTALLSLGLTQVWVRAVVVLIKKSWSNFNYSQSDTILLFVQLALALDYAVIFWGRFRQERLKRPSPRDYLECLFTTLKTSGLVIIVSVAVLEVGFTGMLFYPNLNLGGHLASTLSLMLSCLSVGVHSLLIPAAAAAFLPSVFDEGSSCLPSMFGWSRSDDSRAQPPSEPEQTMGEKIFRKYAKVATTSPCVYLMPAVAYLCMAPFLYQLSQYKPWYDVLETCMDKTLPEYAAYKVFTERIQSTRAEPQMMLVKAERLDTALVQAVNLTEPRGLRRTGRRSHAALAQEGAAGGAAALDSQRGLANVTASSSAAVGVEAYLRQLGGTRKASMLAKALSTALHGMPSIQPDGLGSLVSSDGFGFDSVVFSPEFRQATCDTVEAILSGTKGTKYEIRSMDIQSLWWDAENCKCRIFPDIFQGKISSGGCEEMLLIYPNVGALSSEAKDFTDFMWNKVEPASARQFSVGGSRYRYTVQYDSTVGAMMLGDEELSRRAPLVITGTVLCICACVGIFFRSLGVAVKVLLSVVVPILCNYGLFVAMWQNGWFQWLGIEPTGGVISMLMFTTFGFLLGLAIDYDIVLFARVYERRLEGYDNLSAVQMGLVETGPMVTLAGTLMTSSFLVMCFDNLALIRQIAGLYFIGVALDTYIVRTCIAPTMLVLAGRMNYWPSKMPPETKSWNL